MIVNDIIYYVVKFYYIENVMKKMNKYYEMFLIDLKKCFGEMLFGNKKKVVIVVGFIIELELFILDELMNGFDLLM